MTTVGTRLDNGQSRCPFDIVVRAHGGRQLDTLVMEELRISFSNATGPLNSFSTPPADWFGDGRIGFEGQASAHREAGGVAPFTATVALRYGNLRGTDWFDTLTLVCN